MTEQVQGLSSAGALIDMNQPTLVRAIGTLDLIGAAPQRGRAVLAFALNARIKRLLVIRTATGASPFTTADIEIFDVDPGATPDLPVDLNNTVYLNTGVAIAAGNIRLINDATLDILFRNQDTDQEPTIYVAIDATAGGAGGSTDTFTVIVDAEQENQG